MQTITAEWLEEQGCARQAALFRATFGVLAVVTEANVLLALRVGLDVEWLVRFAPPLTQKTYRAAIAPAQEIYRAAVNLAWETYRAAADSYYADDAARAGVWAAYCAYAITHALALATHEAALASALCELILAI